MDNNICNKHITRISERTSGEAYFYFLDGTRKMTIDSKCDVHADKCLRWLCLL